MREYSIAIIGGGLSGTLVAIHCLDHWKKLPAESRPQLHWIEPREQLGRGIAYSTENPAHLLNVPAAKMGWNPEKPAEFFEWALARDPAIKPTSFLPRKLYGEFIASQIGPRLSEIDSDLFKLHRSEAIDLEKKGSRYELALADGSRLMADVIVLALGNSRPGEIPIESPNFFNSDLYVRDPRDEAQIARKLDTLGPNPEILILGSGLTTIDTVLTLQGLAPKCRMTIASRRGLFPTAHAPSPQLPPWRPEGESLRELFRTVRKSCRQAGADWRSVIDAIRSEIPSLWMNLEAADREQFVRHVQAYWDMHRHRIAPSVAAELEKLKKSGQLHLFVGRVLDLQETSSASVRAKVRARGESEPVMQDYSLVVNCTRPESNIRKVPSAFLRNLVRRGLVQSDPLGLGVEASADGKISEGIWTLGPPLKGILWETTAVPEIRVQAKRLAQSLMGKRP